MLTSHARLRRDTSRRTRNKSESPGSPLATKPLSTKLSHACKRAGSHCYESHVHHVSQALPWQRDHHGSLEGGVVDMEVDGKQDHSFMKPQFLRTSGTCPIPAFPMPC